MDCRACEESPLPTCSFHEVSFIDFDDDPATLTVVRVVPAPPDGFDW